VRSTTDIASATRWRWRNSSPTQRTNCARRSLPCGCSCNCSKSGNAAQRAAAGKNCGPESRAQHLVEQLLHLSLGPETPALKREAWTWLNSPQHSEPIQRARRREKRGLGALAQGSLMIAGDSLQLAICSTTW
jgi:hypothetical protein